MIHKYCIWFPPLTTEIRLQRFPDQEQTVDIQTVDDACICSSLHIQGTVMHKYYHRCPVHNDTMENNRTRRNIVTGHPVHRKKNTPQPVEDLCICSSVHIHGNLVNVRCSHRCPIHNDTMEHDCTRRNIVTGCGNTIVAWSDELPSKACTLWPFEFEEAAVFHCTCIQAELLLITVHCYIPLYTPYLDLSTSIPSCYVFKCIQLDFLIVMSVFASIRPVFC